MCRTNPPLLDKNRLHQFGNKMLSGMFIGYALHAGRKPSGGLLTAHRDDLEKNIASDVQSKMIQVPRNTTLHSTDTICVFKWRMEREATPTRKSNNILPTKRDATATQTTPAKHTSKCRARSGRFLQHLRLSRLPAQRLPRSTRIIGLDPSEVHRRESAVKKKRSLGRKIMYMWVAPKVQRPLTTNRSKPRHTCFKESPHPVWTKHRKRKPLTSLRKFRHGVTI